MLVTALDDIKQYTAEDIAAIVAQAESAARRACEDYIDRKLIGEDNFPCGFAWVEVFGVRGNTKVGRAFKALGFSKIGSGLHWQNPSRVPVQNVDAKMAGAVAAQRVLEGYGFTAYAVDRLD
jgi:hypothetical protein